MGKFGNTPQNTRNLPVAVAAKIRQDDTQPHNQVPPGAPLFISLKPPFIALKANSLGSLTRRALAQLGVNTSVWKPHSTRGAGVTMLKQLGLSSEEVCEIGKWKNVAAFTSHYLRLGASTKVGQKNPTNGAQCLTIGKCGARPDMDYGEN